MDNSRTTRREFFGLIGRGAGLLAVGGLGLHLVLGRDEEKVWQLDPTVCDGCIKLNTDPDGVTTVKGSSICSTQCVLKMSAVKAVNDFTRCGYCRICPGYHKVTSPLEKNRANIHDYDTPTERVCPYNAIIRRPVGYFDKADYKNNFYEYVIDESKCTGCGKCVIECAKPGQGNGSLRLEVRHNLCVGCNQCAIAQACPIKEHKEPGYVGAFYRDDAANGWPGKTRRPRDEDEIGATEHAGLPCGPSPLAFLKSGRQPPRRGDQPGESTA